MCLIDRKYEIRKLGYTNGSEKDAPYSKCPCSYIEAEEMRSEHEAALEWLFEFQELDAKNIQFSDARAQLEYLVVVRIFYAKAMLMSGWIEKLRSGHTQEVVTVRQDLSKFSKHIPRLKKADILSVHEWLQSLFASVRPTLVQKAKIAPTSHEYWKSSAPRTQRYITAGFKRLPTLSKMSKDFYHEVIGQFLEEYGDKILRCRKPSCDQLFVRNRRQVHCSGRCRDIMSTLAWQRRNKDVISKKKRELRRKKKEERRSAEAASMPAQGNLGA
jgi:hypothetical protein